MLRLWDSTVKRRRVDQGINAYCGNAMIHEGGTLEDAQGWVNEIARQFREAVCLGAVKWPYRIPPDRRIKRYYWPCSRTDVQDGLCYYHRQQKRKEERYRDHDRYAKHGVTETLEDPTDSAWDNVPIDSDRIIV